MIKFAHSKRKLTKILIRIKVISKGLSAPKSAASDILNSNQCLLLKNT